jgi:hypothetical protein
MKKWTNRQTMMVVGSLLLLLAVQAISQMAREDVAGGQPFQPAQQDTFLAPARGFEQDSSDSAQDAEQPMGNTLEQPTDNGLEQPMDGTLERPTDSGFEPSMDADAGGFSPNETISGGTQPHETFPSGQAGMDSEGITQRYQTDQESHDRMTRGFDNLIKDEVTLENPNTGEVMQGEAGSSNYYQSPSVDGATGESTIIGAEGGYTPPADATQLNIVGSDSGSSSASSSGAASSDSGSSTP